MYILLIIASFIAGIITGLSLLAYSIVRRNGALPEKDAGEETYSTLVIGEKNMKDNEEIAELAQELLSSNKDFKDN